MYDILAYCESHQRWPGSLDYAARLAASFNSRLTGICVCPSPGFMLAPYETPRLMAQMLEATRQMEQEALEAGPSFEVFARARGAARASWLVAEEEVVRALELAGYWHDVLVVGRTRHTPWGSVSAVGSIVLGTGMPCVAVPEEASGAQPPDCVAIAWNGSAEAIRAVHAARPFLRRARKVVILHGRLRPPASLGPWQPPFDLVKYLADHGIPSESVLLQDSDPAPGGQLLEASKQAGAGMLVMGAYGHARFREWTLGGATRDVLENMHLPVFLRH